MTLDGSTIAFLVAAGFAGGFINAAVGSGTLIVFPALVAAGLAPVAANGTNAAGLSPGNLTAAWAYRAELRGRLGRLRRALIATVVGAVVGATLVVALPSRVFTSLVPWLVAAATVLVAIQPVIARWLRSRTATRGRMLWPWTGAVGLYGGYFGAAQGVMFMAVLGVLYDSDTQRSNAAKNILAASANIAAAIVFAISGAVVWFAALAVAFGSIPGGYVGGRVSRLLPNSILRAFVVVVGIGATVYLVVTR